MSNPQRPTERQAFLRWLLEQSGLEPPEAHSTYRTETRADGRVIETGRRLPLWFDPDEDVEIENPDDEAPDTDQ